MSDAVAVEEKVGENEFDAAFADAVEGTPQTQEEAGVAEPTSEEVVSDVAEAEPESPAPEQADAPAVEPSAVEQELAALRAQLEALKQPAAEPEQEAQPAAEPEPIFTPEQTAALTEFKKEWPEVAAGIDLMMQGALKQMRAQVMEQLAPMINPLVENYQVTAEERQYAAIKGAHADYDDIYDDVIAWVDKQPAYIKNALQHVVTEGSAADVVDMISRYKLETGKAAPSVAPPAPKVADLPEAAKKVARSLGVVSSKRSATPQSQDPTDFDGAWAEAVNG